MSRYVMFAFGMVLLGAVQAHAQASPYGAMPPAQTGQPAQTPYMAAPVPAAPSVQAPVNLPPPVATPNAVPLNLPQIPGYTAPGMPVQQGGLNAPAGGGMTSPGTARP
ncbi:MAG TPA: hypothetical protein VNC39_01410 [Acidocella sp.]|jgi:hypothetical protein|uniref:hypothetical protein n=1 Tax=Acidocella sp. TaxID=50710 RepID=UPI002D08E8D0|nr:hypothetical protein [Acidocella sp.]HVE20607.1 hypothetical protein [Acidocella sp.]